MSHMGGGHYSDSLYRGAVAWQVCYEYGDENSHLRKMYFDASFVYGGYPSFVNQQQLLSRVISWPYAPATFLTGDGQDELASGGVWFLFLLVLEFDIYLEEYLEEPSR